MKDWARKCAAALGYIFSIQFLKLRHLKREKKRSRKVIKQDKCGQGSPAVHPAKKGEDALLKTVVVVLG